MFHANSWGLAFAAPMVGAGLVLPGAALDGPAVRRQLGEHAVTHTAGVPTVFLGLVEDARARAGAAGGGGDGLVLANHAPARDAALAALRLVVVGGAALPRSLLDFFAAAAPSAAVRQAWGMTEISPCGALNAPLGAPPPHALSSHAHAQTTPPLSAAAAHAASEAAVAAALKQGRPHVFMDMRLVDDSGKEVERDGVGSGELQVRGPIALRRYYRGKRDATDKDGWFATGDVATIDGQGRMQITDRAKVRRGTCLVCTLWLCDVSACLLAARWLLRAAFLLLARKP
jgi:fatty-acyl-CoA synthase